MFNSGTLDFGSNRIVDLTSANLTVAWILNILFVMNTIKPVDIARHGQKITLEAKVSSFPPEIDQLAWGASTPGTPNEIETLDGQATMTSPVLTFFDRNGKQMQYQLIGAVFQSTKQTSGKDEYATWDFTLEAKDITALYTV